MNHDSKNTTTTKNNLRERMIMRAKIQNTKYNLIMRAKIQNTKYNLTERKI